MPLHHREEDEFIQCLREFISIEKDLDAQKVNMVLKTDFNLHDVFSIFDENRDGVLSHAEIRNGLAAIGVFPSSEEIDLWFKRYDSNGDNKLEFGEFSEAFLPQDSYYTAMLQRRGSTHRYPLYRRDDCFFPDTAVQFRGLFNVHFKAEVAIEAVRQRLAGNPHFDALEAFNSLDLNNDGMVSATEIKQIIQKRGHYVSDKDAALLLRKFDQNNDTQINFKEVSLLVLTQFIVSG